ncbi:MAG: glycosyltransferase family 2 protein [Bacteroidota bacterium]|nr:glycosyltransferase family 2 protein [Bacteroidota bacterium]MDP4215185.1 glycosyltransferase family 2 protein [Bacteroidota bacterium]MDP4244986.1 glycosyltransferase family 2 protein [Bacteroidota bacterium]MDP4255460.1 glycosyltransferase family 2 protein [Bacteroidota bacterium]MDP4256707.1 glycosyltransferase family 2 protein [Bacteroidota bacterium]
MASLSIIVITLNEEKKIARCLQSVRPIADEIIVMDSYSTDRTGEIAGEMGALFYQRSFQGYGDQKNAAMELARHDYVFFIDADEFLSETLTNSIEKEKKRGFSGDGYTMNRLNNYCGKWIRNGSWYPDQKLRIINRHKGRWNHNIVHEDLVPEEGARIYHLKGNLLHQAYSNFEDHIEKNNRYSKLSAQLLFERGKRGQGYKMVINPFWAFIKSYILMFGFLDGFYGFVIAINIAHLTFLKYTKLYQLQQRKRS